MFDCAIIPANSASGSANFRENVRLAWLFMYFMARAWGLKATDAIGLDRPYEGAERVQMLYVVAEKVIDARDVIRKLPPKYMVDGDFDGFGNRYRTHAVSFSYKHISLRSPPIFLLLI